MPSLKACMEALLKHGIDADKDSNPGVHFTVKRLCLAGFPLDEIVREIILAENMMVLNATMPDGDSLSEDERRQAIKLFREGKSIDDVFKKLRPSAKRKATPH